MARKASSSRTAEGDGFDIEAAVRLVGGEIKKFKEPVVTTYGKARRPAFKVLVSCLLSLRTRDEQTAQASARLFAQADTPEKIAAMEPSAIEKLIYPVGFYRNKARTIREVCRVIAHELDGKTPETIEDLLQLKGVGRKTANLVVTLGHGKPGICVDTHVHRICNIWGYVKTRNPDATEMALRKKLPRRLWIEFNNLLVTFGQNLCKPISPQCSICPVGKMCPRIGVARSR